MGVIASRIPECSTLTPTPPCYTQQKKTTERGAALHTLTRHECPDSFASGLRVLAPAALLRTVAALACISISDVDDAACGAKSRGPADEGSRRMKLGPWSFLGVVSSIPSMLESHCASFACRVCSIATARAPMPLWQNVSKVSSILIRYTGMSLLVES